MAKRPVYSRRGFPFNRRIANSRAGTKPGPLFTNCPVRFGTRARFDRSKWSRLDPGGRHFPSVPRDIWRETNVVDVARSGRVGRARVLVVSGGADLDSRRNTSAAGVHWILCRGSGERFLVRSASPNRVVAD